MPDVCDVCFVELPPRVGPGRPRRYCSDAHKQAAHAKRRTELVRIGRAVEKAIAESAVKS